VSEVPLYPLNPEPQPLTPKAKTQTINGESFITIKTAAKAYRGTSLIQKKQILQ